MWQRLMSAASLMAIMNIEIYAEAFVAAPARDGGFIISGPTLSKDRSPSSSQQGYRARCKLPHSVDRRWRWETATGWREDLVENRDRDGGAVLDEELRTSSSRDCEAGAFVPSCRKSKTVESVMDSSSNEYILRSSMTSSAFEVRDAAGAVATTIAVVALAALGGFPETAAAEAPVWVGPTKLVLDPILLYFELAFVARIVFSWYPALDLNKIPQNLVAWPTEPILRPTRAIVPPAFGVDISPIVWVMICSFLHEILLGQQGILNLISNK